MGTDDKVLLNPLYMESGQDGNVKIILIVFFLEEDCLSCNKFKANGNRVFPATFLARGLNNTRHSDTWAG